MPEHAIPAGYHGLEDTEARLVRLLARGGRREGIGTTREGRPMHAYRWGAEGSPAILVISLLHPMEWIGLESHLALLERLLDPPVGDGRPVRADSAPGAPSILSVPIANPDGFARVERSLRENRPRWVRGNAARVDLNRNFATGHRPRPTPLAWWPFYRPGPGPFSEPETAAIARWVEGRPVRACLSLHSFGRQVFVPPARSWNLLPTTPAMTAAARAAVAGSGYQAGPLGRWSPFFRARGAEIDFLHAATGSPAYLVEISRGGFGRWGAPGWTHPFCLFNPPRAAEEVARVLPVLQRLVSPSTRP